MTRTKWGEEWTYDRQVTTPPGHISELNSRIAGFKTWLTSRGAEVMETTNRYEVLRFNTGDGTSVIYRKQTGQLTWTGESERAWSCFYFRSSFWRATKATKRGKQSSVEVRTLQKRDGKGCFYCGEKLEPYEVTIEHMVAVTHGGPNHISNKALACEKCNSEAGHLSVVEKVRLREAKRAKEKA